MIEEEIDLRQYVFIFIKYWFWIVGGTVVIIAITFAATFFITPTYQSTALVAITQPRLFFQFAPDIRNNEAITPSYQAFPYFAANDDLLSKLAHILNEEGISVMPNQSEVTLQTLRDILEASSAGDLSLVALTVTMNDPQAVSVVANHWVDLYVELANDIYGPSEKSKKMFEAELAKIEIELTDLEAKLVDIGAQTGQGLLSSEVIEKVSEQEQRVTLQTREESTYAEFGILGVELETKVQNLIASQARSDALEALIAQAKRLQTLIDQGEIDESVAVVTLLVESAHLTAPGDQIDVTLEVNLDPDSSVKFNDVLATLESNLTAVETLIEKTSAEVRELQQEMATQRQIFNNLSRQRVLKQEVYLSLARKVAESDLDETELAPVRLISYAAVPQDPIWPQKGLITIIAGILGFFVLTLAMFSWEWWRNDNTASPTIE